MKGPCRQRKGLACNKMLENCDAGRFAENAFGTKQADGGTDQLRTFNFFNNTPIHALQILSQSLPLEVYILGFLYRLIKILP